MNKILALIRKFFAAITTAELWWAIAGILTAAIFYCAFGMVANIVPALTLAFIVLFVSNWREGTARLDYALAIAAGGLVFQLVSLL